MGTTTQATSECKAEKLVLAARLQVYRVLQYFFGNAPSSLSLDLLFAEAASDALDLYCCDDEAYGASLSSLRICAQKMQSENLDNLMSSYTSLFVEPACSDAPPWASVYLSDTHLLFQESTLEVRRKYADEHLVASGYPHVADDHIAIELDFLARLSQRTYQVYGESDLAETKRLIVTQQTFIEDHCLIWLKSYIEAIMKSGKPFYPQLAYFTYQYMRVDNAMLKEVVLSI